MKFLGLWSPGLQKIFWKICKTLLPLPPPSPLYILNKRSLSIIVSSCQISILKMQKQDLTQVYCLWCSCEYWLLKVIISPSNNKPDKYNSSSHYEQENNDFPKEIITPPKCVIKWREPILTREQWLPWNHYSAMRTMQCHSNVIWKYMRHFPHFSLDFVADPAGNYTFKVNNRNTRTRCEICSKLTKKWQFTWKLTKRRIFSMFN